MTITAEPLPFEVAPEHIAVLTPRMFTILLRRLLNAEVQANGLPTDGIHVASNITTADGGEDGRITWDGGPERTAFLPSRLCQFQLKTGKISPAAASRDVLKSTETVKEMVCSVLQDGGHYIMLCAHPYVQKQIEAREFRIREAIYAAGLTIDDKQVRFRDADQIANWVNHHPAVAIWVKEQTQPGTTGPFRSWGHWAGRAEHEGSPWIQDRRLIKLQAWLLERVKKGQQFGRVVGLTGVGKSRLVLEALGSAAEENDFLRDIVLYADESETDSSAINSVVQALADSGIRAILVVDSCIPKTHEILTRMISRSSSRLSLITIDDEIPAGTLDKEFIFPINEAPTSVVEAIVNRVAPDLPSEDQRRLVHFAKGFPQLAIRIGKTWPESMPHATDEEFVDSFIRGRSLESTDVLLKSARLLATFGLVRMEPGVNGRLREISTRGLDLKESGLRQAIERLIDRGIARRRGRYVILQPRLIAMRLAERQWREWSSTDWDDVLAGNSNPDLKVSAAAQLALLNTTEVAQEALDHVCRQDGPFDGFEGITRTGHANVLSNLAEINAEIVLAQIERSLDDVEDLSTIDGDVRRHIVEALSMITFHHDTFEDGARLLLRLAITENEMWADNATGQFKKLFPMLLGNTAADGNARLAVLDELIDTEDPIQRVIVTEALIEGSETGHFWRFVGVETHGSRPALEPWHPATNEEATNYIQGCVKLLARLAKRNDKAGVIARDGLGHHLRSLVSKGFIDTVETVVIQVSDEVGYWTKAQESLGHFLLYDAIDQERETARRVRDLINKLHPSSLKSRVRFLVTQMPWDFPCGEDLDFDERDQRQETAIRELVAELVINPEILEEILPQITRCPQRMAYVFGNALAKSLDAPVDWLERIIVAFEGTPEEERDFDLLSGYVAGIEKDRPDIVEDFKRRAAGSRTLAPILPLICWRIGITASDINLVIHALQAGLLPPLQLEQWMNGSKFAQVSAAAVASLFETMLAYSEDAFVVAVGLMRMYAYRARDRLDRLRPQVRKAADNITRWDRSQRGEMFIHHFEQIMEWILEKGREDPDARATAATLTNALVNAQERSDQPISEDLPDHLSWLPVPRSDPLRLVRPLVPMLLSSFPEITWPPIGQAIVSDQRKAWLFADTLGDRGPLDRKQEPAILRLPEDVLFAWCHAHPDRAPGFVAGIVPILSTFQTDATERSLHPIMARLIEEFGDREGVLNAISRNLYNFGWSGSRATYYAFFRAPLRTLSNHPRWQVRRWAKNMLRKLAKEIDNANKEYEERAAQWEV